jgi:hypothetical protein
MESVMKVVVALMVLSSLFAVPAAIARDAKERIPTMLAMASKALADLVAKVRTATADEMPALAMEATISIDRIVRCCIDPTFAQRLGPTSSTEEMLADLISLGEALQTEIARLFALRFAQLARAPDAISQTRH